MLNVPLATRHQPTGLCVLVVVLLLDSHKLVFEWGVRNSHVHNCTAVVISKIEPLADLKTVN